MKIIFVTNYAIRHQTGLWDSFVKLNKDIEFIFLATAKYDAERKAMHYVEEERSYIVHSTELNDDELTKLIDKTDIVIFAQSDDLRLLKLFKKVKYVVFPQEHIFKQKTLKKFLAIFNQTRKNIKYFPKAKRYLLAPSIYSYKESRLSCLTNKKNSYKFGYFPKLDTTPITNKKNQLIWSGRLLDWKKPYLSIKAIENIHYSDSNYKLKIYGNGPLKHELNDLINTSSAKDSIEFNDFVENEELMNNFRESEIGLFTSTSGEGWGVVLNEMLASGCVTFSSIHAGSTRYLIKDGINGFTYSKDKELFQKLAKYLSMSDEEKRTIQKNAQDTIRNLWNNDVAAQRLYELFKSIIENKPFTKYNDGPLSGF